MKKIITIYFLFSSLISIAQKQVNIWYFGQNAGLDFNSGSPVVLTNSAMNAFEGVSSISDFNGNLLFYTDGMSVWNANHVTMPNGTGLAGNSSTTQSGLIVQQPGSATLYYLFTLDAQLAPNGFKYSIVDMSLNGGLGDVTVKNTAMYTPSTEKINAITHANGFDVWVVTHDYGNNNFQAYTLTSSGFNTTPVVSSVGPNIASMNDVIGYLKISPDGSRLAMAMSDINQFWLFDFDKSTGIVSNPIQLTSSGAMGSGAYGVEFSPNSNILYGSVEMGTPINLYQWDLSSNNAAIINASRINLNVTLIDAVYMGSLSLAPDGKIYFTRNTCSYLGCISDPDVVGPGCNVIDSAIFLMGGHAVYGLPDINQSLYNTGFTFVNLCFGDTTNFDIPNISGLFGAQWNFDDPASGANNISFTINPGHVFTAPGSYNVEVIKFYASYNDTVVIPVVIKALPVVSLGPDTSICTGVPFTINAGSGFSTYLWQDNSTDSTLTVTLPGQYWVTVSDAGCFGSDTIDIASAVCSVPGVNLMSSDTTFCGKQCLDFTDLSTNNPTSWLWLFPGADSTSSTLQNPTNICYNAYGSFDVTLIACNAAGCDTLFLPAFIVEYQLPAQPVLTQSNDTIYCTQAYSYAWYDASNPGTVISTAGFYTTSNGGNYFVIVTDSNGCQNSSPIFTATGISENGEPLPFLTGANPVTGSLVLDLIDPALISGNRMSLFNSLGQEVLTTSLHQMHNVFDVSNLSNGMYFIRFTTKKSVFVARILISR